ncbi:MAG: insulinase family protein [Deltaproteobacteria bacterium]|nr:insulinase family protein [Deltaproteobacteria bacterium]MCB9786057.1 insulinase family protein [Deltaproteobacteria bacterium]
MTTSWPKPSADGAQRGSLATSWPAVHLTTLSNGLVVAVAPMAHLHAAAVSVFARVGSRYEDAGDNGLSHLLEHVLFRGCEAYPTSWELNVAAEQVTPGLGGATYRDFSAFDAVCAPDDVPAILDILGAMLGRPLFAGVDLERRVILEEIADEVDERGRDIDVDNLAKRALFPGDPIAFKIGGTPRRLAAFTEQDCRRWHAEHYVGRNMVVVVAGPVQAQEVARAAAAAFGDLPPGTRMPSRVPQVRPDLPAFEYTKASGSQTSIQLAWALPGEASPDWTALLAAQRLLDDGSCARLRQAIVEERCLAYDVSVDLEAYEGVSVMAVEATVSHKNATAVVDGMLEVLEALVRCPPEPEEWERMRRRYFFELSSTVDSPGAVCSWIGLERLQMPHSGIRDRHDRMLALDPAAVARAAERYLSPSRAQLTVVGELDTMSRAALRRRMHRYRRA